ncbi:PREDICTED: uncharacterized protein LOC108660724 [Theobroma cacao]|uniref:Uncharacterized protein LOC108660724 n=1 Tax=Theobroma cacao TaxID=3641 RepID=A0AB32VRN9_THECC|nr:PREDICTED: uncharacterized protein LOC108660724 [Theobroma cacao]
MGSVRFAHLNVIPHTLTWWLMKFIGCQMRLIIMFKGRKAWFCNSSKLSEIAFSLRREILECWGLATTLEFAAARIHSRCSELLTVVFTVARMNLTAMRNSRVWLRNLCSEFRYSKNASSLQRESFDSEAVGT